MTMNTFYLLPVRLLALALDKVLKLAPDPVAAPVPNGVENVEPPVAGFVENGVVGFVANGVENVEGVVLNKEVVPTAGVELENVPKIDV